MKYNVKSARALQRRLYKLPRPPLPPTLKITELNQQLILDWGSDLSRVAAVEDTPPGEEYAFEGYSVYQLPSANAALSQGKRIATFDVKDGVLKVFGQTINSEGMVVPVLLQDGNDTGVQRFLKVDKDLLADEYGRIHLNNGQEYCFAVTAYTYSPNPESVPVSLESEPARVKGKPRIPFGDQ